MRAREFTKLLKEFAPPTSSISSEILDILQNQEEGSPVYNSAVSLLQQIIDTANKNSQTNTQPAPVPAGIQNQTKQIGNKIPMGQEPQTVSESVPSDLISAAEAAEMKLTPEQLKFYQTKLEQIQKQARAEGFNTGIALARDPDATMTDTNHKIESLLKNLSQIPEDVKSVVADACIGVWRKTKQLQPILNFLSDCGGSNRPIDLPGIIKKGGSGILMDPNNPYYQIVLQLAKLNPGSGNAASGQGEWMLVLAGTDTKKIHPGDIGVGNELKVLKVEVKASDTKEGKTSLTDFVLNSKKQPVSAARKVLVNAINTTLGRTEVGTGRSSDGGISALNDKTLIRLNPLFQEMNRISKGVVQDTFKQMWETVMTEPEMEPYIKNIVNAIDGDGTVRLEKLYAPTAVLAAAYYKMSNKHDILLLLNVPTLSYTVVDDPASIADLLSQETVELTMSSIFDFRENPGAITFKRTVAAKIKTKK